MDGEFVPLNDAITADVEEVVGRVLRHKFGRLSNRRIVTVLRSRAHPSEIGRLSDAELLLRWFTAYDRAYTARHARRHAVR